MGSKKGFTILNQAVVWAIGFLVIQQLIVASSTFWITRLIGSVQASSFSFLWLGLYLCALFLPYLPGALALIKMAKAKVLAQVDFVDRFAQVYAGNVLEWTQMASHNKKTSTLSSEAPRTMDAYLDYIYHLGSSGLNVGFNLLALAVIIEPLLLVSYGVGLALSFLILHLQKKRKKTLALRSQQSRIQWIGMLLRAWDHVLIHNVYNLQIWKDKTLKRGNRFKNSSLKLEGFSQTISIGMAFALLTPSFILVCLQAYLRLDDLTWLAMLIVTLPRLFQVLSYSYEMLFVLADLPMQKSRLATVLKLIDPSTKLQTQSLENRIEWNQISAVMKRGKEHSQAQSLETLLHELPSQGRITLKGENGSGKTSFLLLLKQKHGEKAFYLPTKHELLFRFSLHQLSTGQKARKVLEELVKNVKTPILLLDEWDANLDSNNTQQISKVIDEMSNSFCVVESRHLKNQ